MSTKKSDKAKDLQEITEEQKANQQKNYEARVNSDFLDFKVATKTVVINVPDKEKAEGYQPITLTIQYDFDGKPEFLKVSGKAKLKEEHTKYLGKNHAKILEI